MDKKSFKDLDTLTDSEIRYGSPRCPGCMQCPNCHELQRDIADLVQYLRDKLARREDADYE